MRKRIFNLVTVLALSSVQIISAMETHNPHLTDLLIEQLLTKEGNINFKPVLTYWEKCTITNRLSLSPIDKEAMVKFALAQLPQKSGINSKDGTETSETIKPKEDPLKSQIEQKKKELIRKKYKLTMGIIYDPKSHKSRRRKDRECGEY